MITKKLFILCAALFFAGSISWSKPIDQAEALKLAESYITGTPSEMMKTKANTNFELAYVRSSENSEQIAEKQNYFYVYNIGKNNGFVIVSADTRTRTILGYAKSGKFEYKNMPDNLKNWLNVYTDEIQYAITQLPETAKTATPQIQRAKSSTHTVAPLLGTIMYNQDTPYNDSCPTKTNSSNTAERTVTGCVATAIAQVMRYHKHPTVGQGSHSYKWEGDTLNANFGNTTYDWDNMPTTYNNSETNSQKAAIAQLMYHVGVSVDMNYDLGSNGGSGAVTSKGIASLYNYFGYDAGMQNHYRFFYNINDWKTKIINELNAGRPVIYSGSSNSGGHAFVCDGYDDSNMFHINWGWGGAANGYFELSALNPDNQGIGSSNGGYNQNQEIITGIQKPITGSKHSQIVGMSGNLTVSDASIQRDSAVNFTLADIYNYGAFAYEDGALMLSLYQSNNFIRHLTGYNLPNVNPYYGWGEMSFNNVSFDSAIPNGNYEIKLTYKDENNNYVPVLVKKSATGIIQAEITDTNIIFSTETLVPVLNLTSSPTTTTNLYQNRTGQFNLEIENSGTKDYFAQIGVRLTSTTDASVTQDVITSLTSIAIGETKSFSLGENITVEPGEYYIQVYVDAANAEETTTFPTTLLGPSEFVPTISVMATPTGEPDLTASNINMPTNVSIGQDFMLTVDLTNNGAYFNDKVIAFVFPESGGRSLTYFGYHSEIIDSNQTKNSSFQGNIATLESGNYAVALYYKKSGSWTQLTNLTPFELDVSSSTGVTYNLSEKIAVVNPVGNNIIVHSEEKIDKISVINLDGKLIKSVATSGESHLTIPATDLPTGIYVLKMDVANQTYHTKIIKR